MNHFRIFGFEMARISEAYLSTLSSIMKPYGIDRYFHPLIYITENSGKITQRDLATALRRDKVSAMRMVDYLCKRDLVRRKQDLFDRRCQILEVTDKARELIPKIKSAIQQTNELLFETFSEEEKECFEKSMDKLMNKIDTLPEPAFIVKAIRRNNKE